MIIDLWPIHSWSDRPLSPINTSFQMLVNNCPWPGKPKLVRVSSTDFDIWYRYMILVLVVAPMGCAGNALVDLFPTSAWTSSLMMIAPMGHKLSLTPTFSWDILLDSSHVLRLILTELFWRAHWTGRELSHCWAFIKTKADCKTKTKDHKWKWVWGPKTKVATKQQDKDKTKAKTRYTQKQSSNQKCIKEIKI